MHGKPFTLTLSVYDNGNFLKKISQRLLRFLSFWLELVVCSSTHPIVHVPVLENTAI